MYRDEFQRWKLGTGHTLGQIWDPRDKNGPNPIQIGPREAPRGVLENFNKIEKFSRFFSLLIVVYSARFRL